MKVARPVAQRFTDVPLPDDEYFKALENFYEKLKGVDELLIDPEITSVRLVANPEKMVLKESQKGYAILQPLRCKRGCGYSQ
jgi:Oxyanion-translocating ATPase